MSCNSVTGAAAAIHTKQAVTYVIWKKKKEKKKTDDMYVTCNA